MLGSHVSLSWTTGARLDFWRRDAAKLRTINSRARSATATVRRTITLIRAARTPTLSMVAAGSATDR